MIPVARVNNQWRVVLLQGFTRSLCHPIIITLVPRRSRLWDALHGSVDDTHHFTADDLTGPLTEQCMLKRRSCAELEVEIYARRGLMLV